VNNLEDNDDAMAALREEQGKDDNDIINGDIGIA